MIDKEKARILLAHAYSAHANIKKGWQEYSQYLYIPVASTIITTFLGIPTGLASLIFGFLMFWWLGKAHSHLENEIKGDKNE
ncbi:MAG: hypothetical protein ACP5JN_04170 [Candidatus Micrarchaeia archaeon]